MPQSSTSPQPQKNQNRLEPVLTAVDRKKTMRERVKSIILAGDAQSVKETIKKDAENTTKNLIFDAFKTIGSAITDAVGTAIFKDDYKRKKRKKQQTGFLNYGGYYPTYMNYTNPMQDTRPAKEKPTNPKWDFDGYGLKTVDEDPDGYISQRVPDGLIECCKSKNYAGVNDFFDLVNRSWDYTSQSWGWYDLDERTCYISKEGGYWVLNIPDPVPLRR